MKKKAPAARKVLRGKVASAKSRRAVRKAAPREVQLSWGAMVESLNARVAARPMPVWDLVALRMAAAAELPPPLLRMANVDSSAPDAVRARQFIGMARACIADLHSDRPLAARENMARFLLHVAWHGSRLRVHRGSPAEPEQPQAATGGLVPFEAHRAKDTLIHMARTPPDRVAHRLGELSGLGWPGLVRCAHSLPDWGPGGRGAAFPEGHPLEALLARNDQFNVYLARAAFLLIPPAVPIGNTNHAQYWFTFWRISAPDPDAAQLAFRRDADEVDTLIEG